jgi:hypothetical protein
MRAIIKTVFAIAFLALLASCSSGPRKRINPPKASIQQLAVQPNGQWKLSLRLQNFSNVSTEFALVDATLNIGGQDAGRIQVNPGISVGPESADVVEATVTPTLGAKLVVASALAARQSATYTLTGSIRTTKPKGTYNFTHDSQLDPAPGLTGVMR